MSISNIALASDSAEPSVQTPESRASLRQDQVADLRRQMAEDYPPIEEGTGQVSAEYPVD